MRIAIDLSPLRKYYSLAHRVRGSGFYIKYLKSALERYFSNNSYVFFTSRREIPADIDLVHFPYFEPFFLTLPLINLSKTVVTVHDLIPLIFPNFFPSGIRGKLKWEIQKHALRKVAAIITDSESSKKDINTHAGISYNKIRVVPLAAAPHFKRIKMNNQLRASRNKKYNLPEKFALYVGDVTWNKNLPRLAKAIKKTDIPLVMIGRALIEQDKNIDNGWNSDFLQLRELIKDDKQFCLLGFVPDEDLVFLYNTATLCVVPSLYEGFGLPVIEAMSCGCPVVTTRQGSLPEVAAEAALYVDAFSTDDIARGLNEMFNDETKQDKYSELGLKHSSKFSWEKTAKLTVEVYKTILKTNG